MTALLAELYDRHHLALFRFLLRASGERATAEDLTQEVFVRALAAAPDYREEGREQAWLFRIARNLLIDRRRRQARRPRPVADVEPPPVAASHDVRLQLLEALSRLKDSEREAFLLSQEGGLRYSEIAELTGASVAAVRSRIFRARWELRRHLEPEGVSNR